MFFKVVCPSIFNLLFNNGEVLFVESPSCPANTSPNFFKVNSYNTFYETFTTIYKYNSTTSGLCDNTFRSNTARARTGTTINVILK